MAGLTLGRDADMSAGTAPVAAPAEVGPRVVLASAGGPVAAGASQPLGPDVAERVQDTLDEMDEQTLQGQELLTAAFRDTRSPEPLQALTSFAARQSATIELWFSVLPDGALPERDLERARASLALVADVSDGATGLLAPL